MPNTFKLALIQKRIDADYKTNLQNLENSIRESAKNGAQIVLLSELHNNLYFCQTKEKSNFNLAEYIPGKQSDYFGALAKELKIILIASIFEKSKSGNYYNTSIIIDVSGEILSKYRKIHIPSCKEYNESFYFKKGSNGHIVVETNLGKIGILICYDQWFPEAARSLALQGVDIILMPSAIGFDTKDTEFEKNRQLDAWQTICRSHAIANGIHIAGCNRVGFEAKDNTEVGIEFWGNSFVSGPFGEYLASAKDSNQIIYADINLDENNIVRKVWPFLKEREPDSYSI